MLKWVKYRKLFEIKRLRQIRLRLRLRRDKKQSQFVSPRFYLGLPVAVPATAKRKKLKTAFLIFFSILKSVGITTYSILCNYPRQTRPNYRCVNMGLDKSVFLILLCPILPKISVNSYFIGGY